MPLTVERLNEDLFEHKVRIGAVGEIISYSDSEFVSLIEETSKLSTGVLVNVDPFTPPAADFTEIAVQFAIAGSVEALRYVISKWFLQSGNAIRRALSEITSNARTTRSGRRFVPFELKVGGVNFMFHESVTEGELLTRLEAAQAIVQSASGRDLGATDERRNWARTYSWHRDKAEWTPMSINGEMCIPDDLLG